MKGKKILLSNDDGHTSHLLQGLANHLADLGAIPYVFAPTGNHSCRSLSISYITPLAMHSLDWGKIRAWRICGFPADCVKHGFHFLKGKIDFIISGINFGNNGGRNLLFSGTVACAIEATFKGIPAIALSHDGDEMDVDYSFFKPWIEKILSFATSTTIPKGCFLNVNFPNCHLHPNIQGIRLAKQGKAYFCEKNLSFLSFEGGRHENHFDMDICSLDNEDPASDMRLLKEGFITIVPIQIENLTHQEFFLQHKDSPFLQDEPALALK